MFTEQMKLPTVSDVLKLCPISNELKARKQQFDEQLKENFVSRSRFTVVCGPCSADAPEAMREYLSKLSDTQSTHPNLLIVARVYTAKPHSNGQGYKGTCFHLRESDNADLTQGIIRAREIMLDCLRLGLPVADELLYPELYPYFADLVSYWFVGARSSEDSLHRSFASGLDVCCGVKNGTDGDILKVVDSLYAVSNPCVFPFKGAQIATSGCKYAHVVLRGGKFGNDFVANISTEQIQLAKKRLQTLGLNGYIMADLSHYNSGKVAAKQIDNAKLVVGNPDVNGIMMESYLCGGVNPDSYGVSKTDDCLNFDDTVKVLDILENGFALHFEQKACFVAEVTFFASAKKNLPTTGYRPDAVFNENKDYWGITFVDLTVERFDVPTVAALKFTVQPSHLQEISVGQLFAIMEGARQVGEGKVILK